VNLDPCFYPSRSSRGDGGDGGDGGDLHARYVVVGGYCGEVANVKDGFVVDSVRGRDRFEDVRSAALEVQSEIRSQD
jgi:hypothetical protein